MAAERSAPGPFRHERQGARRRMAISPKYNPPKSPSIVPAGASLGTAATVLATLSLLLPAKAQFWGDWGGGQQRQQQQYPFGGWGWGDRGGWDNRQSATAIPGTRQLPAQRHPDRLHARACGDAEEGHDHQHRGGGRRHGRLARLRPGRRLFGKARHRDRAQAPHRFGPDPLRPSAARASIGRRPCARSSRPRSRNSSS